MSRTLAIVQARESSTRLPGKALADLGGVPVIERVVERLRLASSIDRIVLAIPDTERNTELACFAAGMGWLVYRGSEDDVLGRYVGAMRAFETFDTDGIVRVTADCPFLDPGVINGVVDLYRKGECEMATNNMEPSFIHGHDVEVISRAALIAADELTQDSYEREHVSVVIRRRPDMFRIRNIVSPVDLSPLRLTIDYGADIDLARALFLSLRPGFTTADILWLMERRPDLQELHARALRASGNVVAFAGSGH